MIRFMTSRSTSLNHPISLFASSKGLVKREMLGESQLLQTYCLNNVLIEIFSFGIPSMGLIYLSIFSIQCIERFEMLFQGYKISHHEYSSIQAIQVQDSAYTRE
ncbi:hypothetical protein Sjap_023814 [Stephania japonica]|uniref:Uncharacterized protein n=1 Tax=Stephania japonica TaxID=461633 RepID=A0AAP0EFG8_9MAGN